MIDFKEVMKMFDKENYDDAYVDALIEGLEKLSSNAELQAAIRKTFRRDVDIFENSLNDNDIVDMKGGE